jgi:Golgi nucleoside diphosphatase
LRIIPSKKRQRVISTVRKLFANDTYCPFWDETERVRVISGEEEAVYGWAGVNFLLGNLMKNSEGVGEAYGGAIHTFGALDMGGASSQISFFQPEGDVMSGLFKLQVGQGRHWNVYAHSHLMFGINMAETRRKARLAMNSTAKARLVEGIYDPCLPAGGRIEFKTSVHYDKNGIDTWNASVDDFSAVTEPGSSDYGHYHAVLVNNENAGDWEQCKTLARGLLNKESNAWCEFSHHSSCSFVGVYQPELPTQAASFGEFLAFSNYYHVWQFLQLQPRSSLEQIDQQGQQVCSQNWKQMLEYNAKNTNVTLTEEDLATYCFRAAYVHEMLAYGYGFQPNDRITATNVVNGQKVDWALGSILYEINTLPWDYIEVHGAHHIADHMESNMFQNWGSDFTRYLAGVLVVSILALLQIMRVYRRQSRSGSSRRKDGYETLHDTDEIETLTLRV